MQNLSAYKHIINLTERRTLAELSCAIQTIIRKHMMKTRAAATHTRICAWQEVPSNKVFWWRGSVRLEPFFCLYSESTLFVYNCTLIMQNWRFACNLNIISLKNKMKSRKFLRHLVILRDFLNLFLDFKLILILLRF